MKFGRHVENELAYKTYILDSFFPKNKKTAADSTLYTERPSYLYIGASQH